VNRVEISLFHIKYQKRKYTFPSNIEAPLVETFRTPSSNGFSCVLHKEKILKEIQGQGLQTPKRIANWSIFKSF
jgi:hypothetical protein